MRAGAQTLTAERLLLPDSACWSLSLALTLKYGLSDTGGWFSAGRCVDLFRSSAQSRSALQCSALDWNPRTLCCRWHS